ncbi:MAG: tyrosine-type recombinase/integrase [Armatimonadetes bacterium]|nr:tyrosine-type recombinase/integrase [Armatimonadota bacterium]
MVRIKRPAHGGSQADFLGWLQSEEGGRVGGSIRNVRLAALRSSYFRCLELYCPACERSRWERLRRLPEKRTPRAPTYHLEVHEVNQVFAQVDLSSAEGLRDFALLAPLYNTGARASEIAGVRLGDLFFDDSPSVRFYGKGGRERRCPLSCP